MSTYGRAKDTKTQADEHLTINGTSAKRVVSAGYDGTNINEGFVDSKGIYLAGDFMLEVQKGNVPGYSTIHKFGRNSAISTSVVPVCDSGIYQTPTSAVSLELVSSSAADAQNGAGARQVTVVGLDASWNEQTVTVNTHATDGTTPVAITGTWLRVYRAWVSSSGTYATASAGSHVGTLIIRVASAGATYATIPLFSSFPMGQSLIGAYTVPNGFTAYLLTLGFSSDVSGTKTTDFYFFRRADADDVVTPYSGTMRIQQLFVGTQGIFDQTHKTNESYPAKTDIGVMAKASATTDASVEFELLLIAD